MSDLFLLLLFQIFLSQSMLCSLPSDVFLTHLTPLSHPSLTVLTEFPFSLGVSPTLASPSHPH